MSSLKLKHSGGNSMSIEAPATNPASNLAIKLPATIGSANQILKNSGTAGTLGWSALVEDSSGNVGIGTTSPTAKFDVRRDDTDGKIVEFHQSGGYGIDIGSSQSAAYISSGYGQYLSFKTDPSSGQTERFRIDSSGNKFMDNNFTTTDVNARKSYFSSTGQQFHARGAHETCIVFSKPDGTQIGSIARTVSNIAFNTSSDYRLKENVTGISDGITRLKQLKPSRFNFISDPDIRMDGFLAHEVTAVPEAITGTKDQVATKDDEETGTKKGDPIYQQIDQSKLVPLLTAALQEAIAKIETLETKVAALEAG